MTLHPFQQAGSDYAVKWASTATQGDTLLLSSPTGTGKSYVLSDIRRRLKLDPHEVYLIAPNDDILAGFAAKAGISIPDGTDPKRILEPLGYYTPMRLRNLLLAGDIPQPDFLLIDESHHAEAETYKLLDELSNRCPRIGITATPYRGTPKSTAEFLKAWGDPVQLITIPEACASGYMTFPRIEVVPLLDDDILEVVNGEFRVSNTEEQLTNCLGRAMAVVTPHFGKRPMMMAMPSVYSARLYTEELNRIGLTSVCVTGESSARERKEAFDSCISCASILVQVKVVSEGVDLPVRVLVDMAPHISPVAFLQQFGRITRPTEEPPLYIGTNRNILRHAYLLQGSVPASTYAQVEALFGGPSSRQNPRALGFESLGKFTSSEVPLANGTTGQCVVVSAVSTSGVVTEYAAVASPLHADVLYAKRENTRGSYGAKWEQIPCIPNLSKGFSSVGKGELTPKQLSWWIRSARYYGLDDTVVPNRRSFNVLPILVDTRFRFK